MNFVYACWKHPAPKWTAAAPIYSNQGEKIS
nr:MAG TPA: hypothetical protein [Caudoviricetes sp.]